jgi:hypothetical protein
MLLNQYENEKKFFYDDKKLNLLSKKIIIYGELIKKDRYDEK